MPGETIAQAVVGRYENGFALLVVTDHRLLLVDKKPMFLTLEDLRFDMISEIDYSAQLLDGTVRIMTPNRTLAFTAWNQPRLRKILNYTQQRVSEIRQHYLQPQQQVFAQQAMPPPRDDQYSAPAVGGLALQGNAQYAGTPTMMPSFNPYTNGGITMRKRRVPKFY